MENVTQATGRRMRKRPRVAAQEQRLGSESGTEPERSALSSPEHLLCAPAPCQEVVYALRISLLFPFYR